MQFKLNNFDDKKNGTNKARNVDQYLELVHLTPSTSLLSHASRKPLKLKEQDQPWEVVYQREENPRYEGAQQGWQPRDDQVSIYAVVCGQIERERISRISVYYCVEGEAVHHEGQGRILEPYFEPP